LSLYGQYHQASGTLTVIYNPDTEYEFEEWYPANYWAVP